MTDKRTLYFLHGYKKGDRVRLKPDFPLAWHAGKEGTLVKTPAIGENPVLRVRLDNDGDSSGYTEVDATAEKFERLSVPHWQ